MSNKIFSISMASLMLTLLFGVVGGCVCGLGEWLFKPVLSDVGMAIIGAGFVPMIIAMTILILAAVGDAMGAEK